MSKYKSPDPQSIAIITMDAIRNALGLALGAAVADGHFDANTRMVLADGVQVHVGEKNFWVMVSEDRPAIEDRLHRKTEIEHCSDVAGKVVRDTWGGSMTYVVAHVAESFFLERKEAARARDAEWRAAVKKLLALEPDLAEVDRCPDDELTDDGRAARDAYRAVMRLLEGA